MQRIFRKPDAPYFGRSGFTWNIFDGLNREANIRQTRLTKQTLQLGREKAQNELGVLVDKLYSEIQNAKDDVAALNTTIEMSRELVRIRKNPFRKEWLPLLM